MTNPAEVKVSAAEEHRFFEEHAKHGITYAIANLIARRVPKDKGPVGIWETGFNACRKHVLEGGGV